MPLTSGRILLERLRIIQLSKRFPVLYGIDIFITALRVARCLLPPDVQSGSCTQVCLSVLHSSRRISRLPFGIIMVQELHNLYSSPDTIRQVKSRRMRWAGHVARMGEERKMYRVLVGKPEGKRPQGRPRRRWEDGIRMDLREIGFGGVDWIRLSQDRDRWRAVVSAVMNLRVLPPRS
jgi:hypothetical protein